MTRIFAYRNCESIRNATNAARHNVAHVYVLNEFFAQQVEALHSHDLVEILAEIVACDVKAVNVWPFAVSSRLLNDGVGRATAGDTMSSDT